MVKFLIVLSLFFSTIAHAETAADDMQQFLKSCGYGILGGAIAGTVSLVAENRPHEHYSNIAKGASLGLYIGIAYGLNLINQNNNKRSETQIIEESVFVLQPQFINAKFDGFAATFQLIKF